MIQRLSADNLLLAESITEALILLDIDGYIQYANATACKLTGYERDEMIGQPYHLLNNNDAFKASYELELGKKNGKNVTEGWRYKKDGSRFWAETILSSMYDGDDLNGYSCLIFDRTAKKEKELYLIKNEQRFRLMVEGVRDYAIFLLDTQGYITTWNEGAKRTKGYTEQEIVGKHFSIFYTAEDLMDKKPERELKIAIATGKYEEEGWRVKKNGSVFWANVIITALFNENNELIGFSKVTRDLTERKHNHEALMQSEQRYRFLIEQLMDYGIFMLNEKGQISSWNEGAKRIKGYTPDEIIGKYFSIFYPEEDIIDGKPARELEIARTVGKYEEEGWRLRKDGSRFWANVLITAVYNSEGALMGYSKVTKDLTERKHTEQALKDSYDNYRLLADELQETNTELKKINEELEQFTSIVSHDLQEPLRTIKSFLQLIDIKLTEADHESLHSYITKSIHAANRMKELIQNLLQYTQVTKSDIINDHVSVSDIINEALKNLQNTIEVTHAHITVDTNIPAVRGDRLQLVQLLQNLLSNALKFVGSRNPEIMIRCFEHNGNPTFAVSDNGIGIVQSDVSKIFEIFRRLNTKKDYPGTGIGLAICKKIIDRHHGKIWVESEKDKGTTFYFSLGNQQKKEASVYEKV